MGDIYRYTADEITEELSVTFPAPLIISTLAWILYGTLICHAVHYLSVLSKRDHLLTKLWVAVVMLMTSAANSYQVYFNWSFSIAVFLPNFPYIDGAVNGNTVVLYSVVVMMVQLFWLACVQRMLSHRPKFCWAIIIPIGLLSISSFILAIGVRVLSTSGRRVAAWPLYTTSILVRTVLALDLAVDVSILTVILSQLTIMRRNTAHLKGTISKLSYILCGVTSISTLIMIAEFIISFPQPPHKGGAWINIAISFAPIIPNIYALGILGVLNARTDLWGEKKRNFMSSHDGGTKALIPGLRFTVDLSDNGTVFGNRNRTLSTPVMTNISPIRRSLEVEE